MLRIVLNILSEEGSMAKSCRYETVASNQLACVQRCVDCGGYVVHVGALSVRLDAGSLEALSAILREAGAGRRAETEMSLAGGPMGQA